MLCRVTITNESTSKNTSKNNQVANLEAGEANCISHSPAISVHVATNVLYLADCVLRLLSWQLRQGVTQFRSSKLCI